VLDREGRDPDPAADIRPSRPSRNPTLEIEMLASSTHSRIRPLATFSRLPALVAGVVLLTSCVGTISTPLPPSSTTPTSFTCPMLPQTIVAPFASNNCAGVRLNNAKLVCAGGALPLSLATTPGGATRIDATLADGSVLTATATPVDGRCFDGIPIQIGITTGLRYTAEQGQEITGPSAGSACIVRSRADFSQYVTSDPLLVHPGVEDILKNQIHRQLDTQFVSRRCDRWREL
jgi:hypothetical protein